MEQKSLKKQKLLWKTINNLNYWGVSIATGLSFGWNVLEDPRWFLVLSLGISYYFTLGIAIGKKIDNKLTAIREEERQLILEHNLQAEIHNRLDSYRDKLIFDQDDTYWKILEELDMSSKSSYN